MCEALPIVYSQHSNIPALKHSEGDDGHRRLRTTATVRGLTDHKERTMFTNIENIKTRFDVMDITNIEAIIEQWLPAGENKLKSFTPQDVLEESGNADRLELAESYCVFYFVLPVIATQNGGMGIVKSVGFNDSKQSLLSDIDVRDRQLFYLSEARQIVSALLETDGIRMYAI